MMAERMAAMQAMLNSMTPEQRAQLQGLADQLLEDMDLRWQMDQLGQNLRQAFPQMGWDRSYDFTRPGPARLRRGRAADARSSATSTSSRTCCAAPRRPARSPRSTSTGPASCSATTPPAASSGWPSWPRCSRKPGLIENKEGRFELTPRGIRRIGQNALDDLFKKLANDKIGKHEVERTGVGHERAYDTKPYEFGDPFNLHIERTVRNAIRRTGGGHAGAAAARRLRGRAHRAR